MRSSNLAGNKGVDSLQKHLPTGLSLLVLVLQVGKGWLVPSWSLPLGLGLPGLSMPQSKALFRASLDLVGTPTSRADARLHYVKEREGVAVGSLVSSYIIYAREVYCFLSLSHLNAPILRPPAGFSKPLPRLPAPYRAYSYPCPCPAEPQRWQALISSSKSSKIFSFSPNSL